MAEIAFTVVDTTNTDDFYKNCQCYKAGDIIEVKPDGWAWGTIDLSNHSWRIIKLPGVAVSQLTQFLSWQLPVDPLNPSKTLLRRAFRLAWSLIDNTNWAAAHPAQVTALKNYIADATRTNPTLTVPANTVAALMTELDKLTVQKPLVPDPAVIG